MEMEQQESRPQEPAIVLNKSAADSRNRILYDFTSNAALRNLYVDASGNMSVGKLFEDHTHFRLHLRGQGRQRCASLLARLLLHCAMYLLHCTSCTAPTCLLMCC